MKTIFLALITLSYTVSAQTPHQSFMEIPSSNGFSSVHYSFYDGDHKIAAFYPHIYKQFDAWTEETPNLMFDSYFGIRSASATWMNTVNESSVAYLNGTGIIKVDQDITGADNFSTTTWIFSPFEIDQSAYVMLFEISGEAPPMAAFSLHNLHLGDGVNRTDNETISEYRNGWIEYGPGDSYVVYYRPITAADGHLAASAGASSPWSVMNDGGDYNGDDNPVSGNDLAMGFQFNLPSGVAAGSKAWIGIVTAVSYNGDLSGMADRVEAYVTGKSPEDLLTDEQANWAAHQARATLPANIDSREEDLVRQSIAVLRFAQVREPNTNDGNPYGQILAALPKARPASGEGIWNVAWVRDASYGIVALAKTGYVEEARNALRFMLEARSGEYEQAVGVPYNISVCRYYGSGREETDYNHQGPNIEFDDFGLFLWAFAETVKADPSNTWWHEYWDDVRDLTAGALVKLTENHTFLIAPDSSIWERHWNGNEKRFTYTTAMAVKGLCSVSSLAEDMDDTTEAQSYRDTVSKLMKGMRLNLVDTQNVLAGSMEELFSGTGYLDLAAIEAFNFGIFAPGDPISTASLQQYHQTFFDGTENGHGGYYRNDDGDWYDLQEWSFIDLRMSVALSYNGLTQRRDALLNWVVSQSEANNNLMGELYCRGTDNCPQRGDYRGSVPMIGFGPGALILALRARNETGPEALCATESTEMPGLPDVDRTEGNDAGTDDDAGNGDDITPGGKTGCDCSAAGNTQFATLPFFMALFFAIVFRIYRRKI